MERKILEGHDIHQVVRSNAIMAELKQKMDRFMKSLGGREIQVRGVGLYTLFSTIMIDCTSSSHGSGEEKYCTFQIIVYVKQKCYSAKSMHHRVKLVRCSRVCHLAELMMILQYFICGFSTGLKVTQCRYRVKGVVSSRQLISILKS